MVCAAYPFRSAFFTDTSTQELDQKSVNLSKISTRLLRSVRPISPAARFDYSVKVPIQWEEVSVTPVMKGGKTVIPDNAIQSVKRNTVALKGSHFSC